MLIEGYELTVTSPPCDPGSERWSAFADLSVDIAEVLPYLNATLKGAIYDHKAQILTWRMGGRAVSIRPRQIAVSNLEDREEARAVVDRLVEMVNRTWEKRGEIEPRYERREPPKALDVYRLLPGENCKACGQPTCFVFALKLVAGQAHLNQCPPLYTEKYRQSLHKLAELFGEMPSS
ncbi:MAG: Fe-S cluster protein [Chloroflexi bacterium]|nr:Fe-S cluster protein [Chloroflexota bacterium]